MEDQISSENCILCNKPPGDEPGCYLRSQKGVDGVNTATEFLGKGPVAKLNDYVHADCRSDHLVKRLNALAARQQPQLETPERVQVVEFNCQTSCFYCGLIVTESSIKHRKSKIATDYTVIIYIFKLS